MAQGGAARGPRTPALVEAVRLPPDANTLFLVVQRDATTAMRALFRTWFADMVAAGCGAQTTAPRTHRVAHRGATGWGCGGTGPPLLTRLAVLALQRLTVTSGRGRIIQVTRMILKELIGGFTRYAAQPAGPPLRLLGVELDRAAVQALDTPVREGLIKRVAVLVRGCCCSRVSAGAGCSPPGCPLPMSRRPTWITWATERWRGASSPPSRSWGRRGAPSLSPARTPRTRPWRLCSLGARTPWWTGP
jgi:hypothetical protein